MPKTTSLLGGIRNALGGGSKTPAGPKVDSDAYFSDNAPSWELLSEMVAAQRIELGAPAPDKETGPTNAQALRRTFGQPGEPRVKFYRDHSSWCPYCQKIWLQLEEKKIPYIVEKINMSCYGDKPRSFLAIAPGGALPVMELDGRVMTESAVIASALEREFPDNNPLMPAPNTKLHEAAQGLLRLERTLFSRWMMWLTSGWSDKENRAMFEEALDVVDEELARFGGPFFLGADLSLVDITFTPFLERMVASLAYYKGLRMVGTGRWANLEMWFAAMEARPTYRGMKSDFYTHCHDLPPQLGGCAPNQNPETAKIAAAIDGSDSASWRLPLPALTATSLEPISWPENPALDRLEAAAALVGNHAAVVRFAARGCGKEGSRPVRAPLADPSATPGEAGIPAADAALRHVAHALLVGVETIQTSKEFELRRAAAGGSSLPAAPAVPSAAYLRDRVGVPRDMSFPAARQLRAHLNWFIHTAA